MKGGQDCFKSLLCFKKLAVAYFTKPQSKLEYKAGSDHLRSKSPTVTSQAFRTITSQKAQLSFTERCRISCRQLLSEREEPDPNCLNCPPADRPLPGYCINVHNEQKGLKLRVTEKIAQDGERLGGGDKGKHQRFWKDTWMPRELTKSNYFHSNHRMDTQRAWDNGASRPPCAWRAHKDKNDSSLLLHTKRFQKI